MWSRIAVSTTLLPAVAGVADGPTGGTPCDGSDPTHQQTVLTICQPEEEKGSYGIRYWQMTPAEMCDALKEDRCWTLDDMECDGTPKKCLKWGRDAYAGRVLIPEGVSVQGWGSWSCDGTHRFKQDGDKYHNYNFWDWNWRVDAFKFELMDGYTCDPDATPPIQKADPPKPCKPAEVVGRWTYWFSQQTGDETDQSLSVGLEDTTSTTNVNEYKTEIGVKVKWGAKVGAAAEGGESSWEVGLSVSQSIGYSHSVTNALQKSRVETITKKLHGAGTYWQFVSYVSNSDSCESKDNQVMLPEYIRTENAKRPPCCPPGLFKDIDKASGDCVEGSPNLCKRTPGTVPAIVL